MKNAPDEIKRLPPCPNSPNCVCSDKRHESQWIAPISFEGAPELAWATWMDIIKGDESANIIECHETFMRATFTTPFLKFVDDFQSRLDAGNQLIHVRSASRVGYWDLGVNRRRVERLRNLFNRKLK